MTLHELHFLGTAQWSWEKIWNAIGADADLILNSTMQYTLGGQTECRPALAADIVCPVFRHSVER